MIGLVAQPWWVNLIVLIPPLAWFFWRRGGVPLSARQLVISGVFAASFGFLEAVVVVYLRAASGLLPGYKGTLSDVIRVVLRILRAVSSDRPAPTESSLS